MIHHCFVSVFYHGFVSSSPDLKAVRWFMPVLFFFVPKGIFEMRPRMGHNESHN
jgi:hypothetical protein